MDVFKNFHHFVIPMELAFALDMDGVLRRDHHAIPGAKDALGLLEKNNIPYILLSNGGVLPELLIHEVEDIVGHKLPPSQVINTATLAVNHLSSRSKETVVLIVGAPRLSLPIIEKSGHRNCVFTMQVAMRFNTGIIQGYCDIKGQYSQWLKESQVTDESFPISTFADNFPTHIDEILFCNDSNTWYLDMQILLEALLRNGSFSGGVPNGPVLPPIYVGNPDITYGGSYVIPRLTLGGLLTSTCEVYKQIRKTNDLVIHYMGKPHDPIFSEAHKRLNAKTVYMVGDSLTSDITGANRRKKDGWVSVLVLTGQTREEDLKGIEQGAERVPMMVFSDVKEAVTQILDQHTQQAH